MSVEDEKVLPVTQRSRCTSHPGGILKRTYLDELNITIKDFAAAIGVSRKDKRILPACLETGKSLGLDHDSQLSVNFWPRFTNWINSTSQDQSCL